MSIFEIDPNIRKARTLASEFYTDERYFEMSKDRIFARSWQLIADSEVAHELTPVTLLPGFLDEPILLSKLDGRFDCFSNVCTHRGNILIDEPCSPNLIRCGYHGRRFSLDGKFLSMPEFEGVVDFPTEEDNLLNLQTGRWGNFLFASLNSAAPLLAFIGDAAEAVDIDQFTNAKLTTSREYEVDAHWALYCENYLEGFHIPFVHQSLNEILDYGTYAIEIFRHSSLQTGFGSAGEVAARYLFVFPNLMFNFYPWGISVNIVKPVTKSKAKIEFLTYVSDESKLGMGAGAELHRVELEDEAVVESIQKGIRSRFYTSGRYSPSKEQGTHHFHRLIAEFMD